MAELVCQGSFVSAGEERAARRLAEELPDNWLIVCNKCFVSPRGEQFEVDFIIVGRHHVFVADEKSIGGAIRGNENDWILPSGQVRRNPLNKLHYIASRLAGHVLGAFPQVQAELTGHFVTELVLLSAPDGILHVSDPRVRNQVVRLDAAGELLSQYDAEAKALDRSILRWRQDIIDCLHLLNTPPPVPTQVGAYEILEKIGERPHCNIYRAQLQRGLDRVERLLSVYDLTAAATHDPERQKQVMLRDYQSLARLEGIVRVPRVHEPFPFGERFLVVPSELWDLQPLAAMTATGQLDFPQRLAVVRQLFHDLTRVHDAGVVHRNLNPHNVCVALTQSGAVEVGFTGFDFARLQAEQTIVPDMPGLRDLATPYEAPEVAADLSAASGASDMYSAAVIALELLTGMEAKDVVEACRSEHPDRILAGAVPSGQEAVRDLLELLVLLTGAPPADRADLMADVLSACSLADRQQDARGKTDGREAPEVFEQGDVISNQYRVDRVLGRGATAVTYLVTDQISGYQFVLKQIVRDDLRRALAGTEFRALLGVEHPAIVRVYDVRPPEDEFHLKLEFVPGPTLEELANEFPWRLDRTHELARRVLDACDCLAKHGIYHRDIGPKNIIVSDSGAKLIDFGVARTEGASGTTMVGTPRYRAPEIDMGETWDASCDTYAAGVVLFRVLTGAYPFALTDTSADKHQMVDAAALGLDETAAEYAQVLQQGCHPDRASRTGSAQQLLRDLEAVIQHRPVVEEGEWVDNPLVTDLQAVYKNSRRGNADNRGLDTDFAESTYVRTLLDERLVPEIMDGSFLLVLLTGNPGDGKTAFLEHVRRKLEGVGAEFDFSDPNGWKAGLNGRVYAANYDASESHKGRHANDILDEMLAPLAGASAPGDDVGFTGLLAINDGRLRDYFLHNDRYGWLGSVIYEKLRHPAPDSEPRVALVDLKSRCLTAERDIESPLFERVLLVILEHPGWKECERCKARTACIIRFNRDSLADERNGAVMRARLARLFHLTHLRGTRHTTIRDLRSALSYVIAGVRSCKEIHEEVQSGIRAERWQDALYSNAVFNPTGELDDELEDLAHYDVGQYPMPRWGRFLHYNRATEKRTQIDEMLLGGFCRSAAPMAGLTHAALQDDWYRVMKRVLYFEMNEPHVRESDWRLPPPEDLLPYRHARTFQQVVTGAVGAEQVRNWLCEAISASDGIVAPSVRAGHLCVRTAYREEQEFTVFKRHPVDHFTCRVITPTDARFIETCPNAIEFAHVDGDPSLRIHLDLFELLMRMREGYVPDVLEWQPYVVDLAQFKTRLQRLRSDEVILMESGRVLHRVFQQDGALIRGPVTSGRE